MAVAAEAATQDPQPAAQAQARVSLCQAGQGQHVDSSLGRHRTSRRGAGVGRRITCESTLTDRVGDDRCARSSRSICALTLQMISTTPCLRAGTSAVMRAREASMGDVPASKEAGSARRAQKAGRTPGSSAIQP